MTIEQQIQAGGALRYRPGAGFYVVRLSRQIPVSQKEAEAMLRAGRLRQEGLGPDKFGVYHFFLEANP